MKAKQLAKNVPMAIIAKVRKHLKILLIILHAQDSKVPNVIMLENVIKLPI